MAIKIVNKSSHKHFIAKQIQI